MRCGCCASESSTSRHLPDLVPPPRPQAAQSGSPAATRSSPAPPRPAVRPSSSAPVLLGSSSSSPGPELLRPTPPSSLAPPCPAAGPAEYWHPGTPTP